MSDSTPFGFGKFVPGFDFLQGLAKGAAGGIPQLPQLSNWVAPTISVEELDKRVDELNRAVYHRWVDLIKQDTPLTESCLHLLRVARNLERIADLSTNVAENTVYLAVGKVIKHQQGEEDNPE